MKRKFRRLVVLSGVVLAAIVASPAIALAHEGTEAAVSGGLASILLPPTVAFSAVVVLTGAYFMVAAVREQRRLGE